MGIKMKYVKDQTLIGYIAQPNLTVLIFKSEIQQASTFLFSFLGLEHAKSENPCPNIFIYCTIFLFAWGRRILIQMSIMNVLNYHSLSPHSKSSSTLSQQDIYYIQENSLSFIQVHYIFNVNNFRLEFLDSLHTEINRNDKKFAIR